MRVDAVVSGFTFAMHEVLPEVNRDFVLCCIMYFTELHTPYALTPDTVADELRKIKVIYVRGRAIRPDLLSGPNLFEVRFEEGWPGIFAVEIYAAVLFYCRMVSS